MIAWSFTFGPSNAIQAGVASVVVALTRSKLTKRLFTAPLHFGGLEHIVAEIDSSTTKLGVLDVLSAGFWLQLKELLTEHSYVGFDVHF